MSERPFPPLDEQDYPCLRVDLGDGNISFITIDAPKISIGRNEENVIALPDIRVSRRHAEITKRGDGYVIHNLGRVNPLKVNGKQVEEASLQHMDEIKIGPARLIFLSERPDVQTTDLGALSDREEDLQSWRLRSIPIDIEDCSQLRIEQAVLAADGSPEAGPEAVRARPVRETIRSRSGSSPAPSVVRMNKVLFVLYEISRQLVSVQEHTQLLRTVMDLVFKVVNADFGFLVLVDAQNDNPLRPLVAKYRDVWMRQDVKPKASRTLIKKVVEDRVALLTTDAQLDSRFASAESLVQQRIRSSLCVPLWKKGEIIGVIQLSSIDIGNQFTEDDLELLKSIGCQISMVLEQVSLNNKIREEEKIRDWLARFHSPQVIEALLEARVDSGDSLMQASERRATILFADLIGFTRFSESLRPKEVTLFLNNYFSMVTDIIFEHGGTLDKYIGDGFMAVFGAPLQKDDDAERAIRSALKIRRELERELETGAGAKRFQVRIGINTGHIVAGSVGSPKRLDYTVIGDAVNVASRLESIAEPDQILIGEETFRSAGQKFRVRDVGRRSLKGRSQDLQVYEVLDER
jgi:adenylate cyclase